MISVLKGSVQAQKSDTIILTMAGLGLQVNVPENLVASIGSEIELYTYFHWNPEQGPSLYGFFENAQRDLFIQLISVSGIGPRMGLALISAFSVSVLVEALISGNIGLLSSVSGIGRKKAELLILTLKDKVLKADFKDSKPSSDSSGLFTAHIRDLHDALTSLGYSRQEIMYALDQLKSIQGAALFSFDQLLRKVLQVLVKK